MALLDPLTVGVSGWSHLWLPRALTPKILYQATKLTLGKLFISSIIVNETATWIKSVDLKTAFF